MFFSRLIFVLLAVFTSYSALAEAGVVAFSIGETSVKKGEPILVGQTIVTGVNGHVHIRFVDDALVSLRPNSELTVEAYRYDPDFPENNQVKFFLKKGVARSVTGRSGELNKQGYRMNTPISAIGIRGTDYTVSTTDERTHVVVEKGGVAIAPLDEFCLAQEFGACDSPFLIELSGGTSHTIELSGLKDGVYNSRVESSLSSPSLVDSSLLLGAYFLDKDLPLPQGVGNTPEIAWAHWGRYSSVLGQQFVDMSPYLNSDWRIVSVNSFFGLFVPNIYTAAPKSGVANFTLDRYQVFSIKDNQVALAVINNPSLQVNFNQNTFSVKFGVSNAFVNSSIAATGSVDKNGGLIFNDASQKISGALNSNFDQAGLLFDVQIDGLTKVVGSSAWSKK